LYIIYRDLQRRRNRKNELLTEAGIYEGQDMVLYRLAEQEGQTMSELGSKVVSACHAFHHDTKNGGERTS